jgi:hypothetical protein
MCDSNSGLVFTPQGSTTSGITYISGCACSGTIFGCAGHPATFTPIGYRGAAQHTYTTACDGFHEPGPCPQIQWPYDYAKGGPVQEDTP